jgi:hypothetical protein
MCGLAKEAKAEQLRRSVELSQRNQSSSDSMHTSIQGQVVSGEHRRIQLENLHS